MNRQFTHFYTLLLVCCSLCFSTQVIAQTIHAFALNGSNGFTLEGTALEDLSGAAVSDAGDFNGDGIDDLLIGAYLADDGLKTDAGKVYVVFGKTGALDPILELSNLDGTNGFTINGKEANHQLGFAVSSAGDFNKDNYDDILLSAPPVEVNGVTYAGEVYLIFGKAAGYTATFDLASLDGRNGLTIQGDQAGFLGHDLDGIGDINNDNFDDILLSAPFAAPNSKQSAGISYVIFGNGGTAISTLSIATLNGSNGFSLNGITAYDFSGYSVSGAGDFNKDDYDDLLIGAYAADAEGRIDAGQSYLIYGAASYAATMELSGLNGSNGFAINGTSTADFSGWAVSDAGDINKDNFDDILIGAPAATANGKEEAGKTYVLFGTNSNPSVFNLATLNGINGFTLNGLEAHSYSGSALSNAGNINGDGIEDILIGARDAAPNGFASGAAYLYYGKSSGFSVNVDLGSLDGTNGLRIVGKNVEHQLGVSLSGLGDINGDGNNDFIIGAKGAHPNGTSSGETYILTDISSCLANAGAVAMTSPTSQFSFCEGIDLLDDAQASATFEPDFGDIIGYNPLAGFEYALLLVDANGTIVAVDDSAPYDFDFTMLTAGTYTVYGFSFTDGSNTVSSYLTSIQGDATADDLNQIRQDDNDYTSGGDGNGAYCLDLKMPNINGSTVAITIHPTPSVSTATTMANICEGTALNLSATSIDEGLVYEWSGPDFTSMEQNPTVAESAQALNNGTYTINVSTINACTATAETSVLVDPAILANIPEAMMEVCLESPIQLQASNVEIVTVNGHGEKTIMVNDVAALENIFENWDNLQNQADYPYLVFPLTITLDEVDITLTNKADLYARLLACPSNNSACFTLSYPVEVVTYPTANLQDIFPDWYINNEAAYPIFVFPITVTLADLALGVDNENNTTTAQTTTVTLNSEAEWYDSLTVWHSTLEDWNPLAECSAPMSGDDYPSACLTLHYPAQVILSNESPRHTYAWTSPNGFSSAEQNPRIDHSTTNHVGIYTATISTPGGCISTATTEITAVLPLPMVSTVDITVEEGTPIILRSNLGTGCVDITDDPETEADETYICPDFCIDSADETFICPSSQWDGPNDFNSIVQNPLVTTAAALEHAGTYTVYITDGNACVSTSELIVTIVPAGCDPTLSVETPDVTVEEGNQLQLSATFVAGLTYQWIGPNGFSSTEQNPIVSPNVVTQEAGAYTVTISTENNLFTASATTQVTVNPFVFNCANVDLRVDAGDFSVSQGAAITLWATSPTGVSYQWFGPNNFTSTEQYPTLTANSNPDDAGNYRVTVTDGDGCTETDIAVIKVIPGDNDCANVDLSVNAEDFTVSEGAAITLMATSPTAGVSYQWLGPNNFSSMLQNPPLTTSANPDDAGNYRVTVTDEDGCTETDIAVINVIPDDNNCPVDIIIATNPADNEMITAQNTISTNGTVEINNNRNVVFQAGQSITLKAGFSVGSGSTFSAEIENCAGNDLLQEGENAKKE